MLLLKNLFTKKQLFISMVTDERNYTPDQARNVLHRRTMRTSKVPVTAEQIKSAIIATLALKQGLETEAMIKEVTTYLELPKEQAGDLSLKDRVYKRLYFMAAAGEINKKREWNGQGMAAYWFPLDPAETAAERSKAKDADFRVLLQDLLDSHKMYHRAIEGTVRIQRGRRLQRAKLAVLTHVDELHTFINQMKASTDCTIFED